MAIIQSFMPNGLRNVEEYKASFRAQRDREREREREGRKSGDQVAEKRAPPGQSMLQGNAINTNTNTITKERQESF